MKTAVIILGHGSRSAGADEAIQRIVSEVKKSGRFEIVEHAFLQYARPSISSVLENCIKKNAERIVIVPLFLQSGAHVARDIPDLVEKAKKQHPRIEIVVSDYVGSHPLMVKIVEELAGKSNADCGTNY